MLVLGGSGRGNEFPLSVEARAISTFLKISMSRSTIPGMHIYLYIHVPHTSHTPFLSEYNSSYTEDDLGQTCEINSTVVIELVPYFCSILTLSLVDKAFTDSKESYITVKSHKAGLRTGKLDLYLKVPRGYGPNA